MNPRLANGIFLALVIILGAITFGLFHPLQLPDLSIRTPEISIRFPEFSFRSHAHEERPKQAMAAWADAREPQPPETGRDIYYKTQGIITGSPTPKLTREDYPRLNLPGPLGESRVLIWILAQQHLYFGGFVLGALFWILILEISSRLVRRPETSSRLGRAAREILGLTLLAFSVTVMIGVMLLIGLVSLYPDFMKYLIEVFRPFFWFYGLLFLLFTAGIYLYHAGWHRMERIFSNWFRVLLAGLLNLTALCVMMIGNSWSTFMMSPAGVDADGRFLGDYFNVLSNALWMPMNVHRFFSNLAFAAIVIACYAAYQAIRHKIDLERRFYGWMAHAGFLTMMFALLTIPFGGYVLQRFIYAYRQQMGITLLGGLLAWPGIILILLMGCLFVAMNYYLWQIIDARGGTSRYAHHSKYIFFILGASLLLYITPHTFVMQAAELKAIGGQQHPVVGNFGVESSKQAAVNIMIVATFWSLLLLWRSRYPTVKAPIILRAALAGLMISGSLNIIWIGTFGYYIPANIRVALSIPMVMTTVSIILFGSVLTFLMHRNAKLANPVASKVLSVRAYAALLFMPRPGHSLTRWGSRGISSRSTRSYFGPSFS